MDTQREKEREELLARWQKEIPEELKKIWKRERYSTSEMRDLEYVLCILLCRQIYGHFWEDVVNISHIPEAEIQVKRGIAALFIRTQEEVKQFQRSEEEGTSIFAELLARLIRAAHPAPQAELEEAGADSTEPVLA